jgi:hypothetical protein
MDLLVSALITAGITAVAITAMLLVRRRAPEGSYFKDGDRASGVFGVLAAGFSILLGFIVFLAFSSYDASRSGAETEALTVAQQLETAQLFEPTTARRLSGELACYARFVAGPEWERLESGTLGDDFFNPWGVELFETLETIDPQTPTQENAHGKWLDQTSTREEARQDRIHGAVGIIPTPLWIVLIVISLIIFVYALFFADSGEGPVVQGMLMGAVISVIVMLLLLIQFLDNPFHRGTGSLRPDAMERTLRIIDQARAVVGDDAPLPCDARGVAKRGAE